LVNQNKLIIIISSPSGAGKTTVTKQLLKKIPRSYLAVSCTTRKPREGEINGKDYFFITKEKFFKLKKENKFLETAKIFDNYYGTLLKEFNKKIPFLLLDVDWQGARNIRKKSLPNCYSFFLLPPSLAELKRRLLKRHRNDTSTAIKRISSAKKDIKHWKEYDYVFINKKLEICVKKIIKKVNDLKDASIEKYKIEKLVKNI